MLVHFSKYHGTGNDFVMIDGRDQNVKFLKVELVKSLCERRFGIGADGLIILGESERFDFNMRYFNADGKEGTMCGNGGRCIAAFARQLGIVDKECTFDGIDGLHTASIQENGDIRLKLADLSGIHRLGDGYMLDTGSPHFVQLVNRLDEIDVEHLGAEIRHQDRFGRDGINVNFLEANDGSDTIRVRTYERGVEGETWSCGTGVTAAAIIAGFHFNSDSGLYLVKTRGGALMVNYKSQGDQHFTDIYLTGPASHVYNGTIEVVI